MFATITAIGRPDISGSGDERGASSAASKAARSMPLRTSVTRSGGTRSSPMTRIEDGAAVRHDRVSRVRQAREDRPLGRGLQVPEIEPPHDDARAREARRGDRDERRVEVVRVDHLHPVAPEGARELADRLQRSAARERASERVPLRLEAEGPDARKERPAELEGMDGESMSPHEPSENLEQLHLSAADVERVDDLRDAQTQIPPPGRILRTTLMSRPSRRWSFLLRRQQPSVHVGRETMLRGESRDRWTGRGRRRPASGSGAPTGAG